MEADQRSMRRSPGTAVPPPDLVPRPPDLTRLGLPEDARAAVAAAARAAAAASVRDESRATTTALALEGLAPPVVAEGTRFQVEWRIRNTSPVNRAVNV